MHGKKLDEFMRDNAEVISFVYCILTSIIIGRIMHDIKCIININDILIILPACINGMINSILYLKISNI